MSQSPQERVSTVRRLLDEAEQAYYITHRLHDEIVRIRAWETGPELTAVGYSLGICHGDVEIAASRVAGLRNELQRLLGLLEREASRQ